MAKAKVLESRYAFADPWLRLRSDTRAVAGRPAALALHHLRIPRLGRRDRADGRAQCRAGRSVSPCRRADPHRIPRRRGRRRRSAAGRDQAGVTRGNRLCQRRVAPARQRAGQPGFANQPHPLLPGSRRAKGRRAGSGRGRSHPHARAAVVRVHRTGRSRTPRAARLAAGEPLPAAELPPQVHRPAACRSQIAASEARVVRARGGRGNAGPCP